jgi:heme oxygenase (mycobilin-producing)
VLVVTRFEVDPADPAFAERARTALTALSQRPGFRRGSAGPAVDDPTAWALVTEWDGVGAYRRALSAYEVKVAATPLLAQARDEPSAFEELVVAGVTGIAPSDRAPDADVAGPGGIPGPDPYVAPADETRDLGER